MTLLTVTECICHWFVLFVIITGVNSGAVTSCASELTPIFSGVCVAQSAILCVSHCFFCFLFFFGHCVACPSICSFWLSFCYFQTFRAQSIIMSSLRTKGDILFLSDFFFCFGHRFFSAKLVRTITVLSFQIGQLYLACGCMTIRRCVAYRNDLRLTLPFDLNNYFLNSIFLSEL